MKVLYLVNTPSPYRIEFFNRLSEKYDLSVIFETSSAKDRNSRWKSQEKYRFHAYFLNGLRFRETERISFGAIKIIQKQHFDLIVIGYYPSPTAIFTMIYLKLHKIDYVMNTDGGFIKTETKLISNIKTRIIGSASAWLSPSKLADDYLVHYGAIRNNIHRYPFSSVHDDEVLSRPLLQEQKLALRQNLGINEKYVIISIGSFIHRKGFDLLLKSIDGLGEDFGLYLIGGNPTEQYLSIIKNLQFKNIHFVDFQSKNKLSDYYNAADIFVFPTREDIWGLVLNEAIAHGLPIISTDKALAASELVRGNGRIVDLNCNWKVEITGLLNQRLSVYAKRSIAIAHHYTIENMVAAHEQAFEEILNTNNKVRMSQ